MSEKEGLFLWGLQIKKQKQKTTLAGKGRERTLVTFYCLFAKQEPAVEGQVRTRAVFYNHWVSNLVSSCKLYSVGPGCSKCGHTPAMLALPGSLLATQNLRPHPRAAESEPAV